jgi:uncharacterized protein YjbI with pentapeptide repeats/GTPase SAR1 family protein
MKLFALSHLSVQEDEYQRGLIITDDIAIEPILDFNLYTNATVKIIKESYPKFTIGLFGDWGTGKTTLMNSIYKKLQTDNETILVRFETWRYEREEQFALIPLLKTIAFALPNEKQFQALRQKLKRGAINLFKKSPDIASSILSTYLGEYAGKVSEEVFESFRKEFNSKLELLSEVDRDTLYFDGFEDIRKEIQKIRQKNLTFRIVVFVDDLDRCSPKKALEVLESIKVFLGMEGFIYVIGLSRDIVTKLIDIEYEETGISGEQYIKKMIQIPITLPKWDHKDIDKLMQDFINKELIHKDYKNLIDRDLISTAVENNPREVKRFLNNFIVAYEIFHTIKNFNAKELLLIQAIQLRWNEFYNLLMTSDPSFRSELSKYSQMDDEKRLKILDTNEVEEDNEKDYVLRIKHLLSNYKTDVELWNFLRKNSDTLSNISDLTIYRRSVEVGLEPTIQISSTYQEAYALLQNGDVATFNQRITEFGDLNLKGARLRNANLGGAKLNRARLTEADLNLADLNCAYLNYANLSGASLREASLVGTDVSRADLSRADLSRADLTNVFLRKSNLRGATLTEADLSGATLTEADLREADLTRAILAGTNLKDANLSGTNLNDSIIIQPKYEYLILDSKTTFKRAIIDDQVFIDFILRFTKNVPEKIRNKSELKIKLLKRISDEEIVADILSMSELPE